MLAPGFRVLDERERLILHLRFFKGLTQSQIAQQVGISQMHVSRLIRRALEKIREEIGDGMARSRRRGSAPPAERRLWVRHRPPPPRCDRNSEIRTRVRRECAKSATRTITRMRTTRRATRGLPLVLRVEGPQAAPVRLARPADWDRSTLLNSAGMQPLMPYFLGREQPPAPLLTTVQKCFRTPDIDEVGLDTYHLTFFEMLGNFSFGSTSRRARSTSRWEFVFDHMKVDPDKFWVTRLRRRSGARARRGRGGVRLWEANGLPPERIIRLDRSHNFWSVGGPGPCGPDTELFYDRGEEIGCGRPTARRAASANASSSSGTSSSWSTSCMRTARVTPLPKQNVDTGMGLERAATILQGVIATYDTDGYQEIMDWIAEESGVAYGDSDARRRRTGSSPTTAAG